MSEIDWLSKIHSSHHYFYSRLGYAPNKLIINREVLEQLRNQVMQFKSYILCDLGVTQFMDSEVWISQNEKEFSWAFVMEE